MSHSFQQCPFTDIGMKSERVWNQFTVESPGLSENQCGNENLTFHFSSVQTRWSLVWGIRHPREFFLIWLNNNTQQICMFRIRTPGGDSKCFFQKLFSCYHYSGELQGYRLPTIVKHFQGFPMHQRSSDYIYLVMR